MFYQQNKNGEISDAELAELVKDLEMNIYLNYFQALEEAMGENKLVYRIYVQRGYYWGENVDIN